MPGTRACVNHQNEWRRHKQLHSRENLSGIHRLISRPNEQLPWVNRDEAEEVQAHDDPAPNEEGEGGNKRRTLFSPAKYYCTEIGSRPCGVPLFWALFDRAESPTNILNLLAAQLPTPESRPSYICIDKGCQVLRTAVTNGSFETTWQDTQFIVDIYHYFNHKATDLLCQKWCNSSPTDGSNPNLVISTIDNNGVRQWSRAFNTQVSEQLNVWIAGFA